MLYTLSGVSAEAFAGFPMPRNTDVFGPTFDGEGTVRLDDVTADPRYGHNSPYHGLPEGHLPVRSYLAVPVRSARGEVLGGLFFGHPEPARFTGVDERLAEGIAAHAAVAIDNARLYEAQRQSREVAERAQRRLAVLADASRVLAASLDVDRILDGALPTSWPRRWPTAAGCSLPATTVCSARSWPSGQPARTLGGPPDRGGRHRQPDRPQLRHGAEHPARTDGGRVAGGDVVGGRRRRRRSSCRWSGGRGRWGCWR